MPSNAWNLIPHLSCRHIAPIITDFGDSRILGALSHPN